MNILTKKIKYLSEAPSPRWIPTVGEVGVGEEFEIDEEEAQKQMLDDGPFKRIKKGRPVKEAG